MQQRFLDPSILAGISSLDLVVKTVVNGFVSGLHRDTGYCLLMTGQPLDAALRECLSLRVGRNYMGGI
jgi:hypothetical protein